MSCYVPFLVSLTLAVLVPTGALATILPTLDLGALCDHADLVVVGRAVSVGEGRPTTIVSGGRSSEGRLLVVQLDVEKLLKGMVKGAALRFSFSVPATAVVSSGHRPIAAEEFGVFFLRKSGDGFEVLDPYYPSVVASPGSLPTSGSLLDQVTAEVAHVLASPEAPVGAKKDAVWVLQGVGTPAATEALRAAARDQPASIRVSAIAALLARNDISVLDSAEQMTLSQEPDIAQKARAALAYGLSVGVKDPRAIPNMARLLQSKDVNVRRGAASALRNTQDQKAVQPLTQALNDTDREVQYQAVIGLAEITSAPSAWSPATDTFNQDAKRYLDYWREWAKARKQPPK